MESDRVRKTGIVKELVERAFPNYKGRTFRIERSDKVWFDPYGGGGSFSNYAAVNLDTGEIASYDKYNVGPYNNPDAFKHQGLPPNVVLIEHRVFCGHDMGIIFHVNPANGIRFDEPNLKAAIEARRALVSGLQGQGLMLGG